MVLSYIQTHQFLIVTSVFASTNIWEKPKISTFASILFIFAKTCKKLKKEILTSVWLHGI